MNIQIYIYICIYVEYMVFVQGLEWNLFNEAYSYFPKMPINWN